MRIAKIEFNSRALGRAVVKSADVRKCQNQRPGYETTSNARYIENYGSHFRMRYNTFFNDQLTPHSNHFCYLCNMQFETLEKVLYHMNSNCNSSTSTGSFDKRGNSSEDKGSGPSGRAAGLNKHETITDNGAAVRDGRIQVNDQVDGHSLLGVTQAYAASVLRNTCSLVKFEIGCDKDPDNSEVAQLIRQSVHLDRFKRKHDEFIYGTLDYSNSLLELERIMQSMDSEGSHSHEALKQLLQEHKAEYCNEINPAIGTKAK